MRRLLVLLVLFALLSSILVPLFAGGLALADGIAVRRDYTADKPGLTILDPNGDVWDLTRGPLTISFSLDMSGYTTTGNWIWSQIGLYGAGDPFGIAAGYMAFGSPYGTLDRPTAWDYNDKLVLRNSLPRVPDDEFSYNSIDPLSYDTVSIAAWDFSDNIWFDRGTATGESSPTLLAQTNTRGKYTVSVTYTAINNNYGTMFATVNGRPNMYRRNDTGEFVPAGKYFYTDMRQVRVYADLETPGATISGLTATGAPAKVQIVGLTPDTTVQGKTINGLGINGYQFRTDAEAKANMMLQRGTTSETISGTNVKMNNSPDILPAGTQMLADVKIPVNATPGYWDAHFWYNDDPTGGSKLVNAFKIKGIPPEISGITPDHSRPGTSFTMTITGAHFRGDIPTTVGLYKVGVTPIMATNVKVVSSSKVTADFKIPAGTFIEANWAVILNNDDGQPWCNFSVDAKMDINAFTFLNIIWLRCPWLLSVTLYSDVGFDATKVWPVAVSFGGTFPIAVNTQDVNRDGRKDQIYYFNNMAVNLPVGTNNVSLVAGSGDGRSVEAWDTVRVFKFLF